MRFTAAWPSGSWTEDAPLAPNSPYAAAKAGGDLMARAYAQTHGAQRQHHSLLQ